MVEIHTLTERLSDPVRIAGVYNAGPYPTGGLEKIRNKLKMRGKDVAMVDDSTQIRSGNKVVVSVKMRKASIMIQELEDIRDILSTISGYNNLWVTTDDPLEHPEIIG